MGQPLTAERRPLRVRPPPKAALAGLSEDTICHVVASGSHGLGAEATWGGAATAATRMRAAWCRE
jgi:alkylhydroperoxidase/carboxymuconolactone decarboxylase family protein YurZ